VSSGGCRAADESAELSTEFDGNMNIDWGRILLNWDHEEERGLGGSCEGKSTLEDMTGWLGFEDTEDNDLR